MPVGKFYSVTQSYGIFGNAGILADKQVYVTNTVIKIIFSGVVSGFSVDPFFHNVSDTVKREQSDLC